MYNSRQSCVIFVIIGIRRIIFIVFITLLVDTFDLNVAM